MSWSWMEGQTVDFQTQELKKERTHEGLPKNPKNPLYFYEHLRSEEGATGFPRGLCLMLRPSKKSFADAEIHDKIRISEEEKKEKGRDR